MAKGGFRGGFPGGNQMNMVRQAQKMQQELLKMQQEIETSKFEFTAGGGAVKAVVLGTKELESIEIKPEVVDPDDVEMLEDLVLSAVKEALKKAEETLGFLGLSSKKDNYPFELSGGQKQKVAIASIIALRPKILVLDEPTGELDPVASRNIFSMGVTSNIAAPSEKLQNGIILPLSHS